MSTIPTEPETIVSPKVLHLNLKRDYFEEIRSGEKRFEYRLVNDFWSKRLEGKVFTEIHVKLGYPKADDVSRILIRPWRGIERQTIQHPLFGQAPVEVFAIRVN